MSNKLVRLKRDYYKKFESAYHNAISSDCEFLISRVLYYFAHFKKLDWKIYLRRQFKGTAPDIRTESGNKTIVIIEIKSKAGWIQSIFSKERYRKQKKDTRTTKSMTPEYLELNSENRLVNIARPIR